MLAVVEAHGCDEPATRAQILAFIDEYCRHLTLQDVREWYADAVLNAS